MSDHHHHDDHHDSGTADEPGTEHGSGEHDHGDTMGMHGMVALGTRDVYLTHLAMRSGPHMFQVICRVHFEPTPDTRVSDQALVNDTPADLTDVYRQDRVNLDDPSKTYTVAPTSHFELADLAAGGMARFGATIIRGHFERDSDQLPLLENVSVVIDAIVHSHHLHSPAPEDESPRSEGAVPHLLFGASDEFFLSHRISLHGEAGTPTDCGYHQVFQLEKESALRLGFERRDGTVDVSAGLASLTSAGRLPATGGRVSFDLSQLLGEPAGSIVSDLVLEPEHYLEILMG